MTGPRPKLWRLIVPWKPLPIATAETLTLWPGSNSLDGELLADLVPRPSCVAELDQVPRARGAPAFFRWPSSALVSLRSGRPRRTRAARPRSRRARGRGPRSPWQGPASITVTGTRVAVLGEDLGHAELLAEDRGHRSAQSLDLDVDAGRQVVEALQRVDRLRGRLVDVDQALVGADLEVLARVLVLERDCGSRSRRSSRWAAARARTRSRRCARPSRRSRAPPGRWRRGRTP